MKKLIAAIAASCSLAFPAFADDRQVYIWSVEGLDMEPQVTVLPNERLCTVFGLVMLQTFMADEIMSQYLPDLNAGCYAYSMVPAPLLANAEYFKG